MFQEGKNYFKLKMLSTIMQMLQNQDFGQIVYIFRQIWFWYL